jgi:hypothetical protein
VGSAHPWPLSTATDRNVPCAQAVSRSASSKTILADVDQVREPVQQPAPLRGPGCPPAGEGGVRGSDGLVHFGGAGERDLSVGLAGRRVDVLVHAARARGPALGADAQADRRRVTVNHRGLRPAHPASRRFAI